MARGGPKYQCKETTTSSNGSMFSRWFGSSYDMSGVTDSKVISCTRFNGGRPAMSSSAISPK